MKKVTIVCLAENKEKKWKFGKKYDIPEEEAKTLEAGGYVAIKK